MKGLLFASFGTTYQPAREKHIDAVAACFAAALPEYSIWQAYTSNVVRNVLEKRGVQVPDVPTALQAMAAKGITEVVIQPGHLLPGEEYDKLCTQAGSCRHLFTSMNIGAPLLAGTEDIHRLGNVLAAEYPAIESNAVVFMGHGTHQFANTVYAALDYYFKTALGREDIFVGTVEAYPSFEDILKLVEAYEAMLLRRDSIACEKLLLVPLMQVAGDHALNDMAGEGADSWKSRFEAAGFRTECRLTGLGEMPQVQEIYLEHARQAIKESTRNGI